MFTDWVHGGGNLIAMRPGHAARRPARPHRRRDTLAERLPAGRHRARRPAPASSTRRSSSTAPPTATRSTARTQRSRRCTRTRPRATANPAVTLRSVGTQRRPGGRVHLRPRAVGRLHAPGQPGLGRPGARRHRADPLRRPVLRRAAGDSSPTGSTSNKVAIPQADEQQRLLANLIEQMNRDRKPLPRFWYFPRGEKAAVVMTGDDHGNGGTAGRFDQYKADSPPGCSVADWECVRGTSYIYPNTPLTDAAGRRVPGRGLRDRRCTSTPNCANWTLERRSSRLLRDAARAVRAPAIPSVAAAGHQPHPLHRLERLGDAAEGRARATASASTRTTTTGRAAWVQDRPGMFTGSGMPMRFADADGSMIDVYQAATQMTDESGQTYPFTHRHAARQRARPAGLLRRLHRQHAHRQRRARRARTRSSPRRMARGVPVVSARQMLDWLDGRNGSSFNSLSWSGNKLDFTIDVGAGANGLRAMVPTTSAVGRPDRRQARTARRSRRRRRRSRASSTRSSTRPPAATRRPTRSTTPRRRSPTSPTRCTANGSATDHLGHRRGVGLPGRLRHRSPAL